MVHNEYKEMIPAHALSSLDAADERALSDHLAECAECRRELSDWEATAAGLALSTEPVEPSSHVRETLLQRIQSEKSSSKVLPFTQPPKNIWRSLGSLGAIAAVILFAALIVSVLVLWQQNRRLREENAFFQLLSAPGSRVVELSATDNAAGAAAKIAYDRNGQAVLIANGLPRAPEGKEYQLWYIVGNKPMPGKSFAPDASGKSMMNDQVPEAARDAATFAITLEPAGGVSTPTGAIYLRGEL